MDQIINEYKVITLGDSGTGKSSLIRKFTDNYFTNTFTSTIGVDFRTKTFDVDHQTVRLYVWDTAGQERYRAIARSYYNTAEGIVLVFDITNKDTFITLPVWLSELEYNGKTSCPIVLVGAKSDMVQRRVHAEEINSFLESYSDKFNIQYVETSSKLGTNILEVFYKLGKELLKIKTIIPKMVPALDMEIVNLNQNKPVNNVTIPKSTSCC